MAVKLHKEHFCLNEVMCSRYMQTTVECDVIVPDIKPDILKILQVSAETAITRKEARADKAFVGGVVRMNILYAPDNGIEGGIKSITTQQEFNHSMDIPGAEVGMELFIDAECGNTEYTLVNSRKLQLRSRISLSARLLSAREVDIATGVEETCAVETKCGLMRLYNPCVDAARDILVRERLEVPSGKCTVAEVLKISAKPCSVELKSLEGKAMAKGELKLSTLYLGEGDGPNPEVVEHTVAFSELLEVDGLREGMDAEVDYCLKNLYYEVCQDSDGDRRILSIEASLEAEVRGFDVVECGCLEDAYSMIYPIEIKKEHCSMEMLVASCTNQQTLKEPVAIPDYLPEIHCLCECRANASIENVVVDSDEVVVSGYISCEFLYLSRDGASPACSFSHILPFSQHFDVIGATHSSVCDAKAEAEHISCTIASGKGLEVRAIVSASIKVVEPTEIEVVDEILCDETQVLPKAPAMRVYFVQKGDSLWSIAKKYHTSPQSILGADGAPAEKICPGMCVYIFR